MHYQYCVDCTLRLTENAEHTLNADGTLCTVCGLVPCDHYGRVESDRFHHFEQCKYCGKIVNEEPHKFDTELGRCTICDESYDGCAHEDLTWVVREDRHLLHCNNCGSDNNSGHSAAYVDGVCTVCGQEPCAHENAPWYVDAFKHERYCMDCYATLMEYSEHSAEENGCPGCGSNYCTHEEFTWEEDKTGELWMVSGHIKVCNNCGYDISTRESHLDEDGDGACDACGTKCFHENEKIVSYGDHHELYCEDCGDYLGSQVHWIAGCCQGGHCGPSCTYEDGSDVCTRCGLTNAYDYTWDFDKDGHWKVCSDCGVAIVNDLTWNGETFKKAHEDADGVGGCDACGYGCTHDFKDGVCTICNATDPFSVKVESSEGAPAVDAEIPVQDLLTEEDKAAAEQGTPVQIQLTVENADETVTAEDKAEIEKTVDEINAEAGDDAAETKIGMYLDINLTKTVGGEQTSVTETGAAVSITVEVPEELLSTQEDTDREFSVLRLHNGQVDELEDLDDDPDTVTFETDRFSTYVLAYTDRPVTDPDIPATGDNGKILLYGGLMTVSLMSMAVLMLTGKKRYC